MVYDVLIKGGRIFDGTGNPWFEADIGIKNGRIHEIGNIIAGSSRCIDAKGLAISPGFIDIHSHADMQLASPNHPDFLDCFINQGITTVVTGNCGFSPAPLPGKFEAEFKDYVAFVCARDISWEWTSFGSWLDYLENHGVLLNVAPLVGHLPIRIGAMGFDRRDPSPSELNNMQSTLEDCFRSGAFGFSVGLVYAPSFCAKTSELIALGEIVKKYGAFFAGHFRGYSETLVSSISEFVEIAKATGARMQISHLHAMGKAYWSEIPKGLELISDSRNKGIDIAYDAIPIYIGTTGLSRLFPFKYLEGGVESLLEKLKDPATREHIRREVEEPCSMNIETASGEWWENFVELLGYDNLKLMIPAIKEDKKLVGIPFSEIARHQGISPFEVMADLTLRERGKGCVELVGVSGDKPDSIGLLECLSDRNGVISTDALNTGNGPGNPTSYGAFARVIGYYSRDLALFPLEEAVRKITSFAAQRVGLKDRGLIQEGMAADITIFDSKNVNDISTPAEPARSPQGIEFVLINGKVVKEGKKVYKEKLAGRVLRHGPKKR